MIDAQGTAVAHIGAQHVNEWLIGEVAQRMGVHRRQSPVLPQRAENVGRGSDRGAQAVKLRLTPGLRAALGDANRQIAVQSDRHRLATGLLITVGQLAIGQPL